MEYRKPYILPKGRAAVLLAAACLITPLANAQPRGGALAERETMRRVAEEQEAQELLLRGDESYQAGRFGDAVEAYAGARDLLPDAPATAELRDAATDRYAQASVEYARGLSRKGDIEGAKAAVDKVLAESVAPRHPGALNFRAQLDDPIRTNPALDAEHAADIDQVRRLLYQADGAYDLGKFDEAKSNFEDVLRIDPHNTAARRGMERVAAAKTGYQRAAYDEARATMLSDVDAAWELKVPPLEPDLSLGDADGYGTVPTGQMTVEAKLDNIIIRQIALDQATLGEALDLLRIRAAEHDTTEADPDFRGVDITVNLGNPETADRIRGYKFDLRLSNVPLRSVLKYITDITRTQFSTDEHAVTITPLGSTSEELTVRSYRVPPDFLTSLNSSAAEGPANDDPFAENDGGGGLLTARLSAQEALEKNGVKFPDGSSASYLSSNNTLRVINTPLNHDYISQLIDSMTKAEPVAVSVKVTMIRTQQTNLEELGFDWLVNPFGLSANNMFASGGTTGNTAGRTGSDFISPVGGTSIDGVPASPTAFADNLVTNGLRSGDQAVNVNSIDSLINNPDRNSQSSAVAPGIMSVTGLFSDGQVQMILRGLDQKGGVDLMSQPATVTRSGQASSIEIVREFIYPTEYEPPELPNSVGNGSQSTPVTPATPTAFETRNVGTTLEVLPVADADRRYVDITINPSFIDFDGFINYGSPINSSSTDVLGNPATVAVTSNRILMPVFSAQRANTQLTVADGATIAIGGLMQESVENVEDKVPVLGDIPIVGRLFQNKAKQRVATAIVFLVKVELLDPTGRPYRDR